MTIPAGKFKAQCLQLMDEVQASRQEIVITKFGKPVAKLVPITSAPKSPLFGVLHGSVKIKGDIVHSAGEKWNADE